MTGHVDLRYGRGALKLELDPALAEWRVIQPAHTLPLFPGREEFRRLCRKPLDAPPLREIVRPHERVVIVTPDGTRPMPHRLLISWLLEELPTPPEQVTILLGNGAHRPNTPAEITRMFGPEIAARVEIVNHDAFAEENLRLIGHAADGTPCFLNKRYLEADRRLALGVIEPHFFAGFSGGAKAIVPGVAGIRTILAAHRYGLLAAPESTWGILETNPVRLLIEELVNFAPPDFLINCALDQADRPAALFAGHHRTAHRRGCAFVARHAFMDVPRRFPLVIACNGGYPLDQNIYQGVKGIDAAAGLVEPGGTIVFCAECADGLGGHEQFARLMAVGDSPDDVRRGIAGQRETVLDQWQAQILVRDLARAEVLVISGMEPAAMNALKMRPAADLQQTVTAKIKALGKKPAVAVLPNGFQTVPRAPLVR